MRTKDEIITFFKTWAQQQTNVRAAILTSSRVNPDAIIDFLSDYDIELFVTDLYLFEENDEWLTPFGKIKVRWPVKPRTTFDKNWITRLVLFHDGVRIDFQITNSHNNPLNIDYGYEILIDKDRILTNIPSPTYSLYNIKKPSEKDYEILVNEFWWNATYVPKYLWRDELPFAKRMMGQSIQDKYLFTLLEWYIGLNNDWKINSGSSGRFFKKYLDSNIWIKYESTFSTADIENSWIAFFNAVDLFSELANSVGDQLGYLYPLELENKMRSYYHFIKAKKKNDI